MSPASAATTKWQLTGGTFSIPDGWFVHKVDLDDHQPHAMITNQETMEEDKILIPKSLAYFLVTHFCGSESMQNKIAEDTKRSIGNIIKEALAL